MAEPTLDFIGEQLERLLKAQRDTHDDVLALRHDLRPTARGA